MTIARDQFKIAFRTGALLLLLFELVSIWGFIVPEYSTIAFLIILAATAFLSVIRFDLAVLVLLAELFVGSQGGYMVAFGGEGLFVSLRLGLFLVIFGAWAAKLLSATFAGGGPRREAWRWLADMHRNRMAVPFFALIAVIGFGTLRGILMDNDLGNVFFDANGYAFFALFPAVIAALGSRESRSRAAGLLVAAIVVSVAKALTVEFMFSHRMFSIAPTLYTWIRDTRVGEITIMVGDFYRIFFQSQIFVLWTIFPALLFMAYAARLRDRRTLLTWGFIVWCAVTMVLSLSRSFWFGCGLATIMLLGIFAWAKAKAVIWRRVIVGGCAALAAAVLLVGTLYSFPYPKKTGDVSLASLLGKRAMSLMDSAANSRWALLPKLVEAGFRHPILGSGLGTTVTYKTSDPRLLADIPTGEYTTYAFEWGYHDLWVKFGLLGLVVYAWLIAALALPFVLALRAGKAALREPARDEPEQTKKETVLVSAGLFVGLVAMLATNVFSPYLNHPLGIGILMLMAAVGIYGGIQPAAGESPESNDSKVAPTTSA